MSVGPWDGSASANGQVLAAASVADATSVDASACRPGDVQTFAPAAYRAASGKHQNVCSAYAMDVLYEHCFDTTVASPAACQADTATYSACFECILTSIDAPHYGPLLTDSTGWVRPNVAGCIELSDQSTQGLACAKNVQVLASCEVAACEANCPVMAYSPDSLSAYDECAAQADDTGCALFVGPAACDQSDASTGLADAGDSIAGCIQPTLEAFYRFAVPLFCGAPPPEADGSAPSMGPSQVDAALPSVAASSGGAANDAGTP